MESIRDAYGDAWESQQDVLRLIDPLPQTFGVESNPERTEASKSENGERPSDWDVFVSDRDMQKLVEVKSGAISKDYRVVFWRRLWRQLAHNQCDYLRLIAALVLDPNRPGNIEIWERLPATAAGCANQLPETQPARIGSPARLLEEALWSVWEIHLLLRFANKRPVGNNCHRLNVAVNPHAFGRLADATSVWPDFFFPHSRKGLS